MGIKQVNDVVLVSGLPSQEQALHLCGEIQKWGIRSAIGILPGVVGYQVSIYRISLAEAKVLRAKIGFETQVDE